MSTVQIHSKKDYSGAKSIDFSLSGKMYVATPKSGADQSWIDEFEKLLKYASANKINPFSTVSNPKMYGWHKSSTKGGLSSYVDTTAKNTFNKHFDAPEAEQMEMALPGAKEALTYLADGIQNKGLLDTATRLRQAAAKL